MNSYRVGYRFIGTLVLGILTLVSFGQRGPGGVSLETGSASDCGGGGQSTCRAWLDASTLTGLADGDDLVIWPDVSLSANCDEGAPAPGELPPFFRDDAANTINGYPVVTFEDDRFLLLNSTADLNLNNVTNSKTIFFAFRTSTDVTSKQVLYEEGGCWRGLNIYIDNGFLYCGAYDLSQGGVNNPGSGGTNGNGTDPDNTPQWGYSFVRRIIEPNSTNILTMQFSAPTTGLITSNVNDNVTYIRGWLNGQVFSTMDFSTSNLTNTNGTNSGVNGIGTLYNHPDPIGLGAVNSDYVDADGLNCNSTGEDSFSGRLAELCYYNDLLSESERIIIENYLGAKYFANIIVNDKYDHQAAYGNEVIGIGQQTNSSTNRHNLSQGRNPFLIKTSTGNLNAPDKFFFTGHNGANLLYTDTDVPNNSPNIERLQRTWRTDERASSGTFGEITMTIDRNDLPTAPAGFTKMVLLVDEASPNFPNFGASTTVVEEIPLQSMGNPDIFEIDYDFDDNTFFTIGWLKPEVRFELAEATGIEDDTPATSPFNVQVSLNYLPAFSSGPTTVDYIFVDAGQTAEAIDYSFNAAVQSNGVTFPSGTNMAFIPFDIVNDNIPDDESTEEFLIILQNGANTTAGLNIATNDTLVFSILDDDPPPTGSFEISAANILETGVEYYIKVTRTGNPTDMASTASTVQIRRKLPPNEGTAEYLEDYGLDNGDGWYLTPVNRRINVTFPAAAVSSQIDSVRVFISNDIVDEENETCDFALFGDANIAINPSSITSFSLSITDDDPEPEANFVTDNQTGYESVGDPVVFIELDRPSTRDVTVYYSITGGTATGGGTDYTAASPAPILFAAGDTLAFISPFSVDNGDATGEPDETVIFQLDSAENASIGTIDEHTYTIIDTTPFQWKGASGVGKDSDNIVWIDGDRMTTAGNKSSIPNYSPRDIDVTREDNGSSEAQLLLNVSSLNNRNAIDFRGGGSGAADCYVIDDNSFTNLAGFVERKSYFFVIEPDVVPSVTVGNTVDPDNTECALIYEQGGGTRGLSIYLYNSRLYFCAWNDNGDGPQSPWGYDDGAGSNAARVASHVYARSSQTISPNVPYVVSCHYDNFSNEPLMVYVNGVKGVMSSNISSPDDVGRLYSHGGDIGLGALTNAVRYHFTTSTGGGDRNAGYNGLLAEFIKFHEPQMNPARRTILENYLSAKYDIPLTGTGTQQVFDLAFASGANSFNEEVAGVGRTSVPDLHGDAQGTAVLRVQNPNFNGASNGYLMWGHNGEALTNTWPYSYWNADLPDPVQERSGQVWKFFESAGNPISTADVLINFGASDSAQNFMDDPTLLKLLVHNNADPQDFSNATVYDADEMRSGFVAFFNDIPFSNGSYYALGNRSPIGNSPLPIELLSFNAKPKTNQVELTWSTATEMNNDYFVIERAGEDLIWDAILTRPGAGNSNSRIDYRDTDRSPLNGVSYYRLKQVDFNGDFSYSDPVSVAFSNGSKGDGLKIYPNPSTQGSVFIDIPNFDRKHIAEVRMIDMEGRLLQSDNIPDGNARHELVYGDLTPGIYLIQIRSATLNETKKLIVR